MVLLLLACVVAGPVLVGLQVWYVAGQDDRPPSDAIVVMGAAQYNGDPSQVFTARLQHAAELYHDGVAPRIVTVGASVEGDTFSEAGAGEQWLLEQAGIPRDDIVAAPEGRDTLQSLHAADRTLTRRGWESAVIVTDPWHSLRCRTMAEDMGIDAATSPARDGNPMVGPLEVDARYLTRETLAYIYYVIFRQSTEVDIPI